ncbi:thyroid hormone-inducible hepatic protein isoform X2 [Pteronotus mesoamericanus]|uniref:thyroid hormone-inducible hepatic protein isoform X2 n=1 Tax=Pteronotus mesoamericanus TaxID=1884717 RepID=UPI0023EDD882|nr:thyroid hormone-inducible hepatic protein isoform X2 [Pteronotus parnellii mesoamericanus]
MQVLTKRYPKNCLLTVMDQYSAVVHNMEQVVMFPSLLQDLQLNAQPGAPSLYNYFTMLKAIRIDVDHGLQPREEWQVKTAGGQTNVAEKEAAETEKDSVMKTRSSPLALMTKPERPDLQLEVRRQFSEMFPNPTLSTSSWTHHWVTFRMLFTTPPHLSYQLGIMVSGS